MSTARRTDFLFVAFLVEWGNEPQWRAPPARLRFAVAFVLRLSGVPP